MTTLDTSVHSRKRQVLMIQVATMPFHPSLSSAALRESPNPIPVHSLMLSSHLFFCLPLLLDPFAVPCRIVSPCTRILRCGHTIFLSVSLPWLGDHHALQLLNSVANLLVRHMVFGGNVQKSPIASHLKGLDPSLYFCCQGPALTGIKEGR